MEYYCFFGHGKDRLLHLAMGVLVSLHLNWLIWRTENLGPAKCARAG